MDNSGFEFLKQAFKQVADKYDPKDLGKKASRILAGGAKAAIETAKVEFPKDAIEEAIGDVYGLVSSPEIANGISMAVQSLDFDDLSEVIENAKAQMSDDQVIQPMAKTFKDLSKQGGADALLSLLQDKVNQLPDVAQFMAQGVVNEIESMVSSFEDMEEEDIAEVLKNAIESIPSDAVAQMVFMATQNLTPERITATVQQMTGNLPSGKVLADTLHGVGDAAIKQLDRVGDDKATTPASVQEFSADVAQVVATAKANDNKDTFRKKGNGNGGTNFKL